MGRLNKGQASKSAATPVTVKKYFTRESANNTMTLNSASGDKTESSSRSVETTELDDAAPTIKRDHKDLKEGLLKSFTSLISELLQPLQTQLNELAKDLSDTSKIAENAAELTLTLQGEVKVLKSSEKQSAVRISALENKWRQFNLKLKEMGENVEEGKELSQFISTWLASILELTEGGLPVYGGSATAATPRRSGVADHTPAVRRGWAHCSTPHRASVRGSKSEGAFPATPPTIGGDFGAGLSRRSCRLMQPASLAPDPPNR
ncbi:UNVERIFIED_CONTAM: hypothetical protein K2H54_049719, partial [Gekko kuhli]